MKNIMIPVLDEDAQKKAQIRMDELIKPIGSLGKLETIAVRLAGITGQVFNRIHKTRVLVFAADNGILCEGVTPVPQSVTCVQAANMPKGICGISVLTRQAGAELVVVDIGINCENTPEGVIPRKVCKGTANMAEGPAMTRAQTEQAMDVGYAMALQAAHDGVDVLGLGEMGIGNTSTSSAILATLMGIPVEQTTGKGAGITLEGYRHKVEVIQKAIRVNQPDALDPLDVLTKVGGLDIAAMTGAYLGAASRRLPVVIDGFIAVVAALVAVRLQPATRDYLFASHCSYEPGYLLAIHELGMEPILQLDMRLGEGTGCPLAFYIMDAATRIMNEMATFDEGEVDSKDYIDIRK